MLFLVVMLISLLNIQLQAAISSKVDINLTLEQDNMEGVDEKEWNE